MKSQIAFLRCLLADAGRRCGVSTERDLRTVTFRTEHEGESFLTLTLPTFGKALDRALEEGRFDPNLCPMFRYKGGLPDFLRGFMGQVFHPSGVLLDDPDVVAISAIRQITMIFGKQKKLASPERVTKAFEAYIQCELEVHSVVETHDWAPVRKTFNTLFRDVLDSCERAINNHDVRFEHGPGSVADGQLSNERWNMPTWTDRLQAVFDYQESVLPTRSLSAFNERDVHFYEPGAEPAVRLTAVPKTQQTPRIIAIEPPHNQFVQQGLKNLLVPLLEEDQGVRRLIGFTEQAPNREMAWKGSLDRSLATIDLSEASDRVSWPLVQYLMADHSLFLEAVDACRTREADVPGIGVIPLQKYASMGSALCFPIEAMVFLAIVVTSVCEELSIPVNRRSIKALAGQVRVYGDDIIVPTATAPSVVDRLESFGLKVNRHKSYWNGKFRESCGGDFYDGYWVTPIRSRRSFPTTTAHVAEISSIVALHNQLWERGWYTSADFLKSEVRKIVDLPVDVPGEYQHYTLFGPYASFKKTRWNSTLQRMEAKAYVVVDTKRSDPLDHYGALSKSLSSVTGSYDDLSIDVVPYDERHLERAGRPVASRIVPRWVPMQSSL